MRLCGKMNDGINLMAAQDILNQRLIANVAFDKFVTIRKWQILQVFQTTGIGQQVQVDDENIRLGLTKRNG